MGSLRVPLVAETPLATYRLRNAEFAITGPTNVVVSSEVDPAAPAIFTTLNVGNYNVELQGGWALQRQDAAGPQVVDALLTSENPVNVDILPGSRAVANFSFRTGGIVLELDVGDLDITISLDDSTSGPVDACNPFEQTGCGVGQGCYPVQGVGSRCANVVGSGLPTDATCEFINHCAPGLYCVGFGPAGTGACRPLCNTNDPECTTGTCATLDGAASAGVCAL